MSDSAFDKTHFQQELRTNLTGLLSSETAVNRGQLEAFLLYFSSEHPDSYSSDAVLALLDDDAFTRAMKLVMIFSSLALTIHDGAVFNAALEVFPAEEIPAAHATFVIAVLDLIRDNPAEETRQFFMQGLADGQLSVRIGQLRTLLSGRFAETL